MQLVAIGQTYIASLAWLMYEWLHQRGAAQLSGSGRTGCLAVWRQQWHCASIRVVSGNRDRSWPVAPAAIKAQPQSPGLSRHVYSGIYFCACTGKGVLVHLDKAALVDAVAVAAQDLALAEFSIAPQFCSTSCTFDNKHKELSQFSELLKLRG